jgi:putative flavoprotein involved in K+ transport
LKNSTGFYPPKGNNMSEQINTIIVGGGQGGLSTSYYLKQQGREHIVLEQSHQAAKAWRERWDSFTLNTPNWMTRLPGAEYHDNNPDGFLAREKIIVYFEEYIEQFELPVRYGIRVTAVEPIQSGYLVSSDGSEFKAANVVIAAGLNQEPRIPSFSTNLPAEVHQLHSGAYRNPMELPTGAVLVVGSAQSGSQIAEELYQNGRKVYLSVSSAGRVPRRYRGSDVANWLSKIPFFSRKVEDLPSPKAKFAANPHVTGNAGGHNLNMHQFMKDGVMLLGHLKRIEGNRIFLKTDLMENLEKADKFEADIIMRIDEYILANGIEAPVETLPDLRDGYAAREMSELDLKSAGITSVIWATGYKFDFSFVKLPIFDEDGFPVQKRGVTEFPGLYFVGLPFLHTAASGLLAGVGDDARHVTEHMVPVFA